MENDYKLIEHCFEYIAPKKAKIVRNFYLRLFKVAPELRPLFVNTDSATQQEMLMGALSLVVKTSKEGFKNLEYFINLGKRHSKYGFNPCYFEQFNQCLMAVMEDAMRHRWSQEMHDQWYKALEIVSQAMIEGLKSDKSQ